MLELNSNAAKYGIRIPQSYSEITPELIKHYVNRVSLQKYYSIIAICRKTRVFDLAMLDTKSNRPIISTKAFLAKFNPEEFGFKDAEIGDTVIVTRSSLDLSTNLNTACPLNEETIVKYIRNKEDEELIRKATRGEIKGDNGNDEIILMSYKIVANNNIAAIISKNAIATDILKFNNGH